MNPGALFELNGVAIAAGVVASFFVSFLWYAVAFRRPWMQAMGIKEGDVEDLQLGKVAPYVTSLISYVVLGAVMGLFVSWLGLTTVAQGLALGALTFIAFNLTAFARLAFFEDRPLPLLWIDGGADLITHLIFGALLAGGR